MLHAKEARDLAKGYFEKGKKESEKWLEEHLEKASNAISSAASKGLEEIDFDVEFPNGDPYERARTFMLEQALVDLDYGVHCEQASASTSGSTVLKRPVARFHINWFEPWQNFGKATIDDKIEDDKDERN